MTSKAREEILGRLKLAQPVNPVPMQLSPPGLGLPGEIEKFTEAAQQGAATVFRIERIEELEDILGGYLEPKAVSSIMVAEDARLPLDSIKNLAARLKAIYIDANSLDELSLREAAFNCDVGITCCDLGIAQTGSLVIFHRAQSPRLPSIAPPIHIGLVWADDILDSLHDLTGEITRQQDHLPGALTIISGVSRTADINLNVTLGMHGPLELVIIVIGGEKS